MKNSTAYAKEIRQLFNQLKRSGPKPSRQEDANPLEQLMLAVLSEGNSLSKARTALNRLLANTVDLNDLRASTPEELAEIIDKDLPNALARTAALVRLLTAIYEKENKVALEKAKSRNRRDTREYLESLNGITPYVVASTLLWGFGEHAIPLDEPMLAQLKKEQLIDENVNVAEAQAFLQRHISANEARAFSLLLKRYTTMRAPKGKPS